MSLYHPCKVRRPQSIRITIYNNSFQLPNFKCIVFA